MTSKLVPDSEYTGVIALLPVKLRALALLARLDRPIGWWLLFWPCLFGLALSGGLIARWDLALWMLLGAIVMRGAGCVYNDIVDRDLDAQVERTASRPLPSGDIGLRGAWAFLLGLCAFGLLVLLQLRWEAQIVALSSLLLVAAYPFMKRITYWPQAWLGLVFSWGALVGWMAIMGQGNAAMFWLYAGTIFWVVGYDTIYAHQDREDDAMVGIRSTALKFGARTRPVLAACYAATLLLLALTGWLSGLNAWFYLALALPGVALAYQVARLDIQDPAHCLVLFKLNREVGLLGMLAILIGRM
jgi:4-hydroxybenzoate polyprenyltransferase